MKIAILLITFSLNIFSSVDISDRIQTEKYYKDVYSMVFGKAKFAHPDTFNETIVKLSSKKRKRALDFIKGLNGVIPAKLLMPLTYWRIVSPNKENVTTTLSFTMLYNLLRIRDFIDDPLHTNDEKERGKNF